MTKIKQDDYDNLCKVMIDLVIITYLQGLVQWYGKSDHDFNGTLEFALKSLPTFLWELQYENVKKLSELLSD